MSDITQFLTGFGGLAVFAAVFADQVGLPVPAPPFQKVMVWFDRVGHGVLGVGLVLVVGYVACKYALRRRTSGGKSRGGNRAGHPTNQADKGPDNNPSITRYDAANLAVK
jgi:hypothetical protein